jgi:uncharacterized RDD family membrane protein YckC
MEQEPRWYAPPRTDDRPPPRRFRPEPEDLAEPAGFWLRAGARFLDTLAATLLGAASAPASVALIRVLEEGGTIEHYWQYRMSHSLIALIATSTLGSVSYHTLCEGMGGATLGKLMCGLRVVRENDRPASVGGALIRTLAYYIDAFFFGLVAWASMSNSPRKQRLGDRWGKTAVVLARTLPDGAPNPAAGFLLGLGVFFLILVVGGVLRAV